MKSLKTLWLLSFLLVFQPSLVISESYSLTRILPCIQVVTLAISDLSTKAPPLFKELFGCVNYVTSENLQDLDTKTFRAVFAAFLNQLVQSPSCLVTLGEGMSDLIKPHSTRFKLLKCAYLGVAAECVPKA